MKRHLTNGADRRHAKVQPVVPCQLCKSQDIEVKIIVRNLARLIAETAGLRFRERKPIAYSIQSEKNRAALEKLLRFLFNDKFSEAETFENCQHPSLYKYLQQKTQLDKRHIDMLCVEIYESQAKRNYELTVLLTQIKCYPKTIFKTCEDRQSSKVESSEAAQESVSKQDDIQPQQQLFPLQAAQYYSPEMCQMPMCNVPNNQVAFMWNPYPQAPCVPYENWSLVFPINNDGTM